MPRIFWSGFGSSLKAGIIIRFVRLIQNYFKSRTLRDLWFCATSLYSNTLPQHMLRMLDNISRKCYTCSSISEIDLGGLLERRRF